jgi:hypothetical protein
MSIPKWNDPHLNAGTMIRTALWLLSEIGLGNIFTKEEHRKAFAGVAQADRRLRDLRNFGWIIHTSLEDVTLNPNEQRFVAAGTEVWERRARQESAKESISAKTRLSTFAESDYQCSICGIAGGERYLDQPQVGAVLSVARRTVTLPDGRETTMFTCECKRCRAGTVGGPVSLPEFLEKIKNLNSSDQAIFVRWALDGKRQPLDRAWAEFRLLPAAARSAIRGQLKSK